MKEHLKRVIKFVLPNWAYKIFLYCYGKAQFGFWLLFAPSINRLKARRIGKKDCVTVLFLPANLAMWKYDYLFSLMQSHPRFKPLILPSLPLTVTGEERERTRAEMLDYFAKKGFEVIGDSVVKTLDPDIVFVTQPYGKWADYGSFTFPRALACYSEYSYPTSCNRTISNTGFRNRCWRIFDVTEEHKKDAAGLMSNHGRNIVVPGYLNADYFLDPERKFSFPWKEAVPEKKKIIYAPHWTINPNSILKYATFLQNGELMLDLAKKYADKTQWVFKPHPWLYRELRKVWGEDKTKAYYDAWANLPNATCKLGDYIDLFMTSDAMIHDSGSFRCEYFYAKKPVMHLIIDDPTKTDGEVAKIALKAHYLGHNAEEIEAFIVDVVLGGNDPKARERQDFYNKYLLPPNGKTVAQNIIDEIARDLGWR